MNKRKILLIFILIFFILNNVLWWQKNKFIQGPDEAKHLYLSIKLYEFAEYPNAFLKFQFSEAPFYYFTAGIFYKVFQNTSYPISLLNNILYIILLLIGISKLERLLLNTSGIFTAFFLMFIPAIGIHSRFFNPDIALCTIIIWFIYFTKKLNDTIRFRYFIALLLLIFVGGYTKITFYVFAVFPILYYFCLALKRKEFDKIMYNFILGIILLISFCVIYPSLANEVIAILSFRAKIPIYSKPNIGSQLDIFPQHVQKSYLDGIMTAVYLLINSQLSMIIFIFFIFSLIVFLTTHPKAEDKFNIIINFLGPLITFSIIRRSHLETRYFLPLVIFEAIIISYGVNFLFKRKKISKFIVSLFLLFSIIQYYGISYSKTWIDSLSKIKILNQTINLTYFPFSSHDKIFWSLPYLNNPVKEIVDILSDNFKKGISNKVLFLGNDLSDPFFLFISKGVNYYALRKGFPSIETEDIYEANYLMVRDFNAKDVYYNIFQRVNLDSSEIETHFKKFLEQTKIQFYKKIDIYNPLTKKNESFILYLRGNRDFISEAIRKIENGFIHNLKLSVTLTNQQVLSLDKSLISVNGPEEFLVSWPEHNFSLTAQVQRKPNQDIIVNFSSANLKEIKVIQAGFSVHSQESFSYYTESGFQPLKGRPRILNLKTNHRFIQGIKTADTQRYFIFLPQLPRQDEFCQIDYLNKKELQVSCGLRPLPRDIGSGSLFSVYMVNDLREYPLATTQALFLGSTKLSVTLTNHKVLSLDKSRISFNGADEFLLFWPEHNFSLTAQLQRKPNHDIMLNLSSDNLKEIRLINIKTSLFFKPPLYYYDDGIFKLFKGPARRLILKNSYDFCKGFKTETMCKYVAFIPRLNSAGFLSQMFVTKENGIDIVYYFKPAPVIQNSANSDVLSFYVVGDLKEYEEEINKIPKIKNEISFGNDFKFTQSFNTFKIYFKNKELTKDYGLYLSILKEFWHDPQDVLWSIENLDVDKMVVIGEYLNFPITQRWIISKESINILSIDLILIVKERIDIEEAQIVLMLNPDYDAWEAIYLNRMIKKGKFIPFFGNRWKTIWQGKADSINISPKDLPLLHFDRNKKEILCDRAFAGNTDSNFKAHVIGYNSQPKKLLGSSEYLCFSGKIQLGN